MNGHEMNQRSVNAIFGKYSISNSYSIIECKTNLEHLIKKHGDNGFAIISAFKNPNEYPEWDNEEKSNALENDIQNEGYSYTVGWGVYKAIEDDSYNASYEKSFIIYNYISTDNWHENKKAGDVNALRDFVIRMCAKYDQKSAYLKEPGKPPVLLDGNGETTSRQSSDKARYTADIESAYDILSSCGIQFINKQALGFQAKYRQACRGEIGIRRDI